MNLSFSQKLLIGFGALAAYLFITSSASASTGSGTPALGGTGGPSPGGGGNVATPHAGDHLLVVTTDPGLAGRLYIRSGAGTGNPQVALANHGDTLTATGNAKTAADGTNWWEVRNAAGVTGWSEANYLQDTGQ
jgi:hypothetical protein